MMCCSRAPIACPHSCYRQAGINLKYYNYLQCSGFKPCKAILVKAVKHPQMLFNTLFTSLDTACDKPYMCTAPGHKCPAKLDTVCTWHSFEYCIHRVARLALQAGQPPLMLAVCHMHLPCWQELSQHLQASQFCDLGCTRKCNLGCTLLLLGWLHRDINGCGLYCVEGL